MMSLPASSSDLILWYAYTSYCRKFNLSFTFIISFSYSSFYISNEDDHPQVTAALAQAGLESSNLIVGIDFTKSNEWTGLIPSAFL